MDGVYNRIFFLFFYYPLYIFIYYLVGGLEHGFYFSIYWEYLGINIPID